MLNPDTVDAGRQMLQSTYTRFFDDGIYSQIIIHHGAVTDTDFLEALKMHCEVSEWMPKPAHIKDQLNRIAEDRRLAAEKEHQESYGRPVATNTERDDDPYTLKVPVTKELLHWDRMTRKKGAPDVTHFYLRIAQCKDCSDSGMARFWYDRREIKRTWVRAQWMQLEDAAQDALKMGSCTCHCDLGLQKEAYFKGNVPSFASIRTLANRRQAEDRRRIKEAAA